ncbi:hypothetical protein DPMN_079461 [Dreissena polymorpha]|uniref:Uncharacterized protein n=1 Tax=Dreissena polymorpha TaxID=45954 RepID=A0A9D3YQS8_DREPO|nr:hypothetical protein DPMN_079461 [Dreissena polymorpha]
MTCMGTPVQSHDLYGNSSPVTRLVWEPQSSHMTCMGTPVQSHDLYGNSSPVT